MPKIPIKPHPKDKKANGQPEKSRHISWTKCLPFACNVRGVLAHRVKHVTSLLWDGELSHHHVTYLCMNGANINKETCLETFCNDPGERLLCQRCEDMAAALKLPSSDTIAGRHCHRGKLVAEQTCCLPQTPSQGE